MVRFALTALPIAYALTALAGILVYIAREVSRGAPTLWSSLVIGFVIGAGFLFFWVGDALDRPAVWVYLVYAGFGVTTMAVGHLIAFGFNRGGMTKRENSFRSEVRR